MGVYRENGKEHGHHYNIGACRVIPHDSGLSV